jgi:hypothetical protein
MTNTSSKIQHGYLVLADISGYTSFIAGTELEHSQAIVSDILESILNTFSPLLTLSKLEGDAVFCYALEDRLPRSETLIELIEATYVAFRDHREAVGRRTTCTCAACRAIPTLDLKFVVHHGDFFLQNIAGIREMAGSAVNLVHRLLKNHVAEASGWSAYALYTGASLEHLGLPRDGFLALSESYEHLGEVATFSADLHARYREIVEARRAAIEPSEADCVFITDFAVPPAVAWEWVNDPGRRNQYNGGRVTWTSLVRPGGRTQPGARNHCAHGRGVSIETIIDWHPFEYVTAESTQNGQKFVEETIRLEPLPNGAGTRVTNYLRFHTPLPTWLRRLLFGFFIRYIAQYPKVYAKAASLSAEQWAARQPYPVEPTPTA